MKKNYFSNELILIFGLLFLSFHLVAQSIEWQKTYGGSDSDRIISIEQTTDGGYIVAGDSYSDDGDIIDHIGSNDYWIIKINKKGELEWRKNYGGSSSDVPSSIKQTLDGGYIIGGTTISNDGDVTNSNFGYDSWIVKLDQNGDIEWEKTFGGTDQEWTSSIQQTTDEGYVFAGSSGSTDGDVIENKGALDYWIAKLDNAGNIDWSKTYGGSSYEYIQSMQQTTDGGYIVAGLTSSTDGDVGNGANDINLQCWVLKLNETGDIEWNKTYGDSFLQVVASIQQTTDGGYIIGASSGAIVAEEDYWILKIDQFGNTEWEKKFGGSLFEGVYSMIQTIDGGYIIAGYTLSDDGDVSENKGGQDCWIVKLDQFGNLDWEKSLGGSGHEFARSIRQTNDEGFIIAGQTDSNDGDISENKGAEDYWIVKLNPIVTGINTVEKALHYNITPNPSNGDFSITLAGNNKTVQVRIYDLIGNIVFTVKSDSPQIQINGIPKGFYLINISNEELSSIAKLIIQ